MQNKIELLKIGFLILIFLFTSREKYKVFDETGGELNTYSNATLMLFNGENPYIYTVGPYEQPDLYLDHGYAYMPTLMYLFATPLFVHQEFGFPLQRLWKAVVLLADIGVGIMLIKFFYKKSYLATVFALALWCYNPYFLMFKTYSYTEPFGVLFLLLALHFLEKDDMAAGLCYAASVSFKAFPVILFPLFLYKSKNKWKFLFAGAAFAFIMSVPFLRSVNDVVAYIKGAFLVHGSRDPQGRPFLFFIKYYTALPLFYLSKTRLYVYIATFSGMIVTSVLYFTKLLRDKYILSMISFFLFYLFTPVLNRTYLIWFIPVYLMGIFKIFENSKYKFMFYVFGIAFYAFYTWYLSLWFRGVRVFGDYISL